MKEITHGKYFGIMVEMLWVGTGNTVLLDQEFETTGDDRRQASISHLPDVMSTGHLMEMVFSRIFLCLSD